MTKIFIEDDDIFSVDHWSPDTYASQVAPIVAQRAKKIINWLDPGMSDKILELGCDDETVTAFLYSQVAFIVSLDESKENIGALNRKYPSVIGLVSSCVNLPPDLRVGEFDKVFSYSRLHSILNPMYSREQCFHHVSQALRPGGRFVVEMDGPGNLAAVNSALLGAVARRTGRRVVQIQSPWWYADVAALRPLVERVGMMWERHEVEVKSMRMPAKEVTWWLKRFSKEFLEQVVEGERNCTLGEVEEVLEKIAKRTDGDYEFHRVRLRFIARKPHWIQ